MGRNGKHHKKVFKNGVRLLWERVPNVRSVSIGIWVDVGSRNENEDENGISHFIEHMLFKGTSRLNSERISAAINAIGGNVNAFTTQEDICLHARVVDRRLPQTIELLSQLLLDSKFAAQELERERNVILEEVKMYNDTPDELVVDLFTHNLWRGNSLGRPILGSVDTLRSFRRSDLLKYRDREFGPERVVIALAGNFDPRAVERQFSELFDALSTNGTQPNRVATPSPTFSRRCEVRDLEQTHFCIGTLGPERSSEDRYAFSLLNLILGGGSGSRLFLEIREKRGLAYAIHSFNGGFKDTGMFAITGGTSPKQVDQVLGLVFRELGRICDKLPSAAELRLAKEQMTTALLLGLESTHSRMIRLAESELSFGHYVSVEETMRRVEAVKPRDILHHARKYLKSKPVAFSAIGASDLSEKTLEGMTF